MARACPECRISSHFVVPSAVFVTQPTRKAALLQGYQDKLRRTPCKHFAFGGGTCPFGSSCFYAHTDKDGRSIVDDPRFATAADGSSAHLQTYRLCDYLFDTQAEQQALLSSIPMVEEDVGG